MTLHIVNRSAFQDSTLSQCITAAAATDVIVLIEDGVYGTLSASNDWNALKPIAEDLRCYALTEDLLARGLNDKAEASIQTININEFVALTTQHNPIQSWF